MVLRIVIDRDRCVGSGNCLYWAPGTFDLGDDGISVVVDPAGDDEERIRVAAEGCPTRAITIDGGDEGGSDAAAPGLQGENHDENTDEGDPCRSH